jgi:methanogenic corrinoid protein MtbC1
VEDALAQGLSVPEVYLDVLQPALYGIGHRWALGEISVAEEHYATAVSEMLLGELSAHMRRSPRDGRLAAVAGTPGEQHGLGGRMVADFLEADGWDVLRLGAGAPAADLAALVERERPDVVALSTSTAGSLPGVADALQRLDALQPRPLLVAGGQFWSESTAAAAGELGADLVLRDVRLLVVELRRRFPPVDGAAS